MYRETAKSKKYSAVRAAKERRHLDGGPVDCPPELPGLRKIIVVIDFDCGKEVDIVRLYRTGRIDQYCAEANAKLWRDRIGLSGVLAGIRKSMPRVRVMNR